MNQNFTSIADYQSRVGALCTRVMGHIEQARNNVTKSINTEMVKAYWLIGREIVEEEQQGRERAEYGKAILKEISLMLEIQRKYKVGIDTLEQARKFYLVYSEHRDVEEISDTLCRKSSLPDFNPNLSWSHYRELIRIKSLETRNFYEIETLKNNWSVRELKRQVGSLLFERLLKSQDKKSVLKLANKGHEMITPNDIIKDPIVLEFLDLPESHRLVESKLEEALTNNLQNFLMELGRGFAFVARQKRLTLEGDHFYADLVFYHVILKCYIIVDIKTKPLTHNDLGQMQLYVNYFDEEIKVESDAPSIGLVLCTEKNQTMVKYTLGV